MERLGIYNYRKGDKPCEVCGLSQVGSPQFYRTGNVKPNLVCDKCLSKIPDKYIFKQLYLLKPKMNNNPA